MVDFDDLLRACCQALETDPAFAAAQRWRFQHLFVDEFQDVNPLQLALLDAWRGTSTDLCVVGDPHQAIYGWNGADARFLSGFRRLYPSADVVVLDGNYRSTPQILGAAGEVLRRASVEERTVRPARHDGPQVRLERHPTDRAEAVAIARAVRDGRAPGAPWSAQAVLVRTHAQVEIIAEAFRGAGIPHRVRGSESLLDRPAVRAAVDLLRRSPGPLTACLPDVDALADGRRARGLRRRRPVGPARPRPPAPRPRGHRLRLRRLAGGHAPGRGRRRRARRRHHRHVPRGQGARVAATSTWPASRTASCPSPTPARRAGGRRRRGCSTWR